MYPRLSPKSSTTAVLFIFPLPKAQAAAGASGKAAKASAAAAAAEDAAAKKAPGKGNKGKAGKGGAPPAELTAKQAKSKRKVERAAMEAARKGEVESMMKVRSWRARRQGGAGRVLPLLAAAAVCICCCSAGFGAVLLGLVRCCSVWGREGRTWIFFRLPSPTMHASPRHLTKKRSPVSIRPEGGSTSMSGGLLASPRPPCFSQYCKVFSTILPSSQAFKESKRLVTARSRWGIGFAAKSTAVDQTTSCTAAGAGEQ